MSNEVYATLPMREYERLLSIEKAFNELKAKQEIIYTETYSGELVMITKDEAISKLNTALSDERYRIERAVLKIDDILVTGRDNKKYDFYWELRGLRFNVLLCYLPQNHYLHT